MEAYGNMELSYKRLFDKIKESGSTQKELKETLGIGGTTMTNLVNNRSVTTETIGKICEYFGCQPNDVMEVIFDEDYVEKKKQKEKDKITAQMAELQKKLENLN